MENEKVIFIEDNIHDAELIRLSFKQTKFAGELLRFSSGQSFLTYLQSEQPTGIRFVMMDMEMPRMNGLQVLETLNRKNLKNFPVLFFSASRDEQLIRRTEELGACAYIHKPVDFDEFQRAVTDIWRFFGELNEFNNWKIPARIGKNSSYSY